MGTEQIKANAVGVNSGDQAKVERTVGRIARLEQAITDEKAKTEPRAARILELEESIGDHTATLDFLARKIKRQQRAQ